MKYTAIFGILAIIVVCLGCGPAETVDDRTAIESIADDIEKAVNSGDMMLIDKHLSLKAKSEGFDANRLLMELTYTNGLKPAFSSRSVRVMKDSAWLEFAVYPNTIGYSDFFEKSRIRLMRSGIWKIVTYDINKNEPLRETPADSSDADTTGMI